ncbi:MAG: hypothetical protein ACI9K2_006716, partial [Myxococcota bacterium]
PVGSAMQAKRRRSMERGYRVQPRGSVQNTRDPRAGSARVMPTATQDRGPG